MTFDITALSDQTFYGTDRSSDGYIRSADGYFASILRDTTKAAAKVWLSVLDNTVPEVDESTLRWKRKYFEETPFDDLAVGDLIAVGDQDDYRSRRVSLAQWVAQGYRPARLYVVVKRTAKQVQVQSIANPAEWYGYDFDLDLLGESYAERWGHSSRRFIVRLGSHDEIVKAVQDSPEYLRWKRVHDDAMAAVAEHERRMQAAAEARAKAVQAAEEPFRAPTQALNEALGFEVFRSHTQGIERTGSFQSVPTEALVMMLQGQVATGTFSGDYQAILDLLTSTAVRQG